MCASGARWCARADAIFDVPDMHVIDVEIDDQQRLLLTIESGQTGGRLPGLWLVGGRPWPSSGSSDLSMGDGWIATGVLIKD